MPPAGEKAPWPAKAGMAGIAGAMEAGMPGRYTLPDLFGLDIHREYSTLFLSGVVRKIILPFRSIRGMGGAAG